MDLRETSKTNVDLFCKCPLCPTPVHACPFERSSVDILPWADG